MFVGNTSIKGILFNDEIVQAKWNPPASYQHSAGHFMPILLAGSPTITRISQQVLPTAATPTAQSVLVAWRAAVICTERGTGTECYCVCCEDVGNDSTKILWRVSVNCGYEPAVK